MNILDKTVAALEDSLEYISRYMIGKDFSSYCELATSVGLTEEDTTRNPSLKGPYILVNDNLSMLTVFDVQGMFQMHSRDEFNQMIANLRLRMGGYMRQHGHSLTFSFERDPERAMDELMRLAEPQLVAARRMGIDTADIILDRVRRNVACVSWEQNLLVVYTHIQVMGQDELKRETLQIEQQLGKQKKPVIQFGQSPSNIIYGMKHRHDAMIERIKMDFERCGINSGAGVMIKQLDAHEAIKRIRIMVNRERTAQTFRPVLFGDKMYPHGKEDDTELSHLCPPLLSYQICTNNVTTPHGEIIKTDELWHGNLSMELGPQEPQPFSTLFESIDKRLPWRMRVDLNPRGLNEVKGRRTLLMFAAIFPGNRDIKDSLDELAEIDKEDPVCTMKISFSTWANEEGRLRRQLSALDKAIQTWGMCQLTQIHGDPLLAWSSTIPAFTTRNMANRLLPPLTDALQMMPFQRPASPWAERGSCILRTPDGKIYPIQPGSRIQDSGLSLISAPTGSGKSVFLNTLNFAAIHKAGSVRLPLKTIIEVGSSSQGLSLMIQAKLPAHRQHEVVYLKLQNSREFAVNPFDTQLGARSPTYRELEFIESFMMLFCTDPSTKHAPQGCSQVISMLIKIAYDEKSTKSPMHYEEDVEPLVDQALQASGIQQRFDASWWSCATWWEVTDLLFQAGFIKEASLAQRQAVPCLPDFSNYLSNPEIQGLFGDATVMGTEPLLAYMHRCFTVAAGQFPVFSGRTRFELNSQTRMVSIDLNDVIGGKTPEGELKTAMMYLFARQLAAKNYFLREETILPVVPAMYHDYHRARVADIQDEPKYIDYDEIHNAGKQAAFTETLIKDSREVRKWGIHVSAASQCLDDHPPMVLNSATSVYVLRGGNALDEDILRNKFKVSEETIRRLNLEARGPRPEGGSFLALFKTRGGVVAQMLTNTTGSIELWAFSTTPDDMALRARLYQAIGHAEARSLLAKHFPTGSALDLIEEMKSQTTEFDQGSAVERLAKTLIQQYHAENKQQSGFNLYEKQ